MTEERRPFGPRDIGDDTRTGTDWLVVLRNTRFRLRPDGRIQRENDPDASPGPRFWLAGGADGNVFAVRDDLPAGLAVRLAELALQEPPLLYPAIPRHTNEYLALLDRPAPSEQDHLGLIYDLPHALAVPGTVNLIDSDGESGRALLRTLSERGIPAGLQALGFRTPADFWPPWCAVVADGDIVSVAFAARLSDVGAGLGVATEKAFRGRGFAAAATTGWTALASLRSCTLFYSTDRRNRSSQRVAARLSLRLRATSLRIP